MKDCPHCGRAFQPGSRGRPPTYCCTKCQQAAWQARTDARWRAYFEALARTAQDQAGAKQTSR